MRRWFELGFTGDNPIIPSYNFGDPQLFYENSGRRSGRGGPLFVAMPFKEQLFNVIAALSVVNFQDVPNRHLLLTVRPVDQGVDPAPDCLAIHLPRPYSFGGYALTEDPQFIPNVYQQLMGGFAVCDWAGKIVGSTDSLFDLENNPQTKN